MKEIVRESQRVRLLDKSLEMARIHKQDDNTGNSEHMNKEKALHDSVYIFMGEKNK